MSIPILREPCRHPSAWSAEAMRASSAWVLDWPREVLAELESAAHHASTEGRAAPCFGRDDFPLHRAGAFLEEAMRQVATGRGFVLLRGLPVHKYERQFVKDLYWGLGCHWGEPITQNAEGSAIAEIVDHGLDANRVGVKPSMTNAEQRPHSDPGDVVSLLCVHGAKSGGQSRIASSLAIYNRLLEEDPEGLECLYRGFHHDLRGDETPEAPFGCTPVPIPVFRYFGGLLSCVFNASSVKQAERRMGRPIPAREMAILDRIVELAHDPAFCLEMTFQPGDIQLLNNYTVVHWRTKFEDWPEAERKRRLYRLWISRRGERAVDPAMHRGYITGSSAGRPVHS